MSSEVPSPVASPEANDPLPVPQLEERRPGEPIPGWVTRWLFPGLAGGMTVFLWVLAFPPFDISVAGMVFALPFLYWLLFRPSFKVALLVSALTGLTAWSALLIWVRHSVQILDGWWTVPLGFGLVFSLAAVLTVLFWLPWAVAAWWVMGRMGTRPFLHRLAGMLALAGAWVFMEWLRTWLFSGFPWLPLAGSQWTIPGMLQILPFTGFLGLSFVLIFFNLGITWYVYHLINRPREREWWRRFSPDFYLALGMILGTFSLVVTTRAYQGERTPLFMAGFVQPNTPVSRDWDAESSTTALENLDRLSRFAAAQGADVILWPESASPWPVVGHPDMTRWMENLSRQLDRPILGGALLLDPEDEGSPHPQHWYNGIISVSPSEGLLPETYAKRKLLPFGEYFPFANLIPFIESFVGLDGSLTTGENTTLIPLTVRNQSWQVGALICSEDLFPSLAREFFRDQPERTPDFFLVVTNNAWFGEEAGAYQHAVHSVLRAVEMRRPLVRVGNAGWSGWIDEWGNIREVVTASRNGIYHQGTAISLIDRSEQLAGTITPYMRWGDWVVLPCMLFMAVGFWTLNRPAPKMPEPGSRKPKEGPLRERIKQRSNLGKSSSSGKNATPMMTVTERRKSRLRRLKR